MKRLLPISLAFAASIFSVDAQEAIQQGLAVKPSQPVNASVIRKMPLMQTQSVNKAKEMIKAADTRAVAATGAAFRQPQGAMFCSISPDGFIYPETYVVGSPFAQWTYVNTTSGNGTYKWTYYDENDTKLTSTDKNLTMSTGYARYRLPVLDATISGSKTSYALGGAFSNAQGAITAGGTCIYTEDGQYFDFSNANPDLGFAPYRFGDGEYCFGTGSGQEALVSVFDKPQTTLLFEGVNVYAGVFSAPANTEFTMRVIRIDTSTGYIEYKDTLGVSTLRASDVKNPDEGFYSFNFSNFIAIDGDGFESEIPYFEIDDAFVLEFSGFYNNGTTLAVFSEYESDPDTTPSSFFWLTQDGSRDLYRWTDLNNTMAFTLTGGCYSFINCDKQVISADVNGGSYDFKVEPLFKNYSVEEVPSWIDVNVVSEQFDENAWEANLRATVEALPSGTEGRHGEIKLGNPGAHIVLPVIQGVTGISTSKAEVYTVNVVGNDFVLTYPATATSVSVINANGQLVANYGLDASGTTNVPASVANGIYMFKFNGEKDATVKVVR